MMNVLITGCSRGIGLELVHSFAKIENTRILGIARSKEMLHTLELNYGKQKFRGVSFDLLTLREKWTILECDIAGFFQNIDIIINNAGLLYNKPFLNTNMHEIERTFTANVFAPMELVRRMVPYMEKSKNPHVVNIGSMGGFQGSQKYPGLSWYSSSKAALACLTECLALELSTKNISVNCLALGAVQTVMLSEAFPGFKAKMQANEISEFITDFSINGHKYFNGRIIPVSQANI